ncbi:hypothetical protein Clacol_000321 [Clathrus columnatus]|uniref:Glycan binding protein Y3-like domain-containing protein n=1 Tax=Clathrus columnatus TaxID=1419009 RepID=A0AAV4ZYH6_9AGAM|nr:hypothetical protein Clacol_000321 [Clathrus columnatus]
MRSLQLIQLLLSTLCVYAQLEFECLPGISGSALCGILVPTFCQTLQNVTFSPGDSLSRCFNIVSTNATVTQCDFTTLNVVSDVLPPSVPNCESVLENIIVGCPTGGIGQFVGGSYTFAVQPGNTGSCSNP